MRIRGTTTTEADAFVGVIASVARFVTVSGNVQVCRDPDDDLLLETAILGAASHVVSRDEDVVRDPNVIEFLRPFNIAIATVGRFLAVLDDTSQR